MTYDELSKFTHGELRNFTHKQLMQDKLELLESLADERAKIPKEVLEKLHLLCKESLNIYENLNLTTGISISSETANAISTVTNSADSKSLNWEQILLIISFITSIILFVQAQIPSEQTGIIENSLHRLIEIQSKELELIRSQPPE